MSLLAATVLVLGLLLALTRRARTAVTATGYFLAAVLISSWIKQSKEGMALTLGDVHFFLLHPAQNFALFITYPLLLASALALVGGAVAILLTGKRFERPLKVLDRLWARVATAA